MKQAATLFIPLLIVLPGLTLTSADKLIAPAPLGPASVIPTQNLEKGPVSKIDHTLPAESLYQLMAAEMALDRELPEVALANYIAAAKETQDADVAARATQIALSVASLETAVLPATIWAHAAPTNLEAQITTAALYIRLNDVEKAVPFLEQAEKVNADEAFQYYLILFKQLQKEQDNKRVVAALELLAKKETKHASGHLALAEIYLYQGNDVDALKMCEAALQMVPTSVIGIQIESEALLRKKGKVVAKEFLDKHALNQPEDIQLHQYYAQFLLDNGYADAARKELLMLVDNPKVTNEELLQFARLSMQAQWLDIAQKVLKRTKEVPESKDLSHYFLARIAEMQNKDDEAIEWFKQVLTGPFHVLSQVRASVLLSEQKRFDDALEILSHAQPSDLPEKKQLVLSIVDVYNLSHRYNDALKLLDENIALMPDEIDLRYARSIVADKLDKTDIAESDLKAILALQPNHLDALNALGFLLANKTKRFDEAQTYLSQALKISPNNASVLDSLGWLYYKQGDYKKSLETLKQASEIMPDAEIAAHLGEVMWYMKDFDGAKKVWSNALESHPKHEQVIKAMKRLIPAGEQKAVMREKATTK
ncbi:MAG: tetratricopeptide repeat protein [Proteobacteria bacterium]|nr:tetratricopeptide repeat protein [Pseudomonadota bacterium]